MRGDIVAHSPLPGSAGRGAPGVSWLHRHSSPFPSLVPYPAYIAAYCLSFGAYHARSRTTRSPKRRKRKRKRKKTRTRLWIPRRSSRKVCRPRIKSNGKKEIPTILSPADLAVHCMRRARSRGRSSGRSAGRPLAPWPGLLGHARLACVPGRRPGRLNVVRTTS